VSFYNIHWVVHAIFLIDLVIRLGLSVRVIMRRLPVGVALAWLAVVLVFPIVGAIFYLLVGEYRLGPRRARRAAGYEKRRSQQIVGNPPAATSVDPATLGRGVAGLARLIRARFGAAVLAGHHLELQENADAAFPALIADIDRARVSCCLEFYIWSVGGRADEVGAALARAVQRGVSCRVLVDALGSSAFLRSAEVSELRQKGVRVDAALGTSLLSVLFVRPDLRMHRKIVVIDGEIGYTGSLNLADPTLFKKDAGVGQWVDALVRVRGPAVDSLIETFAEDWFLETDEWIEPATLRVPTETALEPGSALVQVLASGPGPRVDAIEQVILMALYAAEKEVVLTTPYFVPSESLLTAMTSASARGVQVTLIVPARIDSRLVHFGSRAFQVDLLTAAVRVALFKNGLLHTKSITVDGAFSLFGSVNLDPRSFRLDLEITLAIYDAEFTAALRRLQQFYLDHADMLDLGACHARSALERFTEDTARLAGPVL
jgi:cardiolipin synthase A/B